MGLIRQLISVYIRGSIHVAAALSALLAYTELQYDAAVPEAYYGLVFFGAIAGYNAIKYGAEPWKRRLTSASGRRVVWVVSSVAALLALACASRLTLRYWMLVGGAAALSALYALPLWPGFRNLRSFGLFKVPLVAVVWVHLTLWAPLWEAPVFARWDYAMEGIQRLLWVSILMLPFEIRDIDSDPEEMRTWPMRWGLPGTRRIAWVGSMVFIMITLLKDHYTWPEFLSKCLAGALMGLAVHYAHRQQGPFYASLWVESIPIATCFVFWLALQTAG